MGLAWISILIFHQKVQLSGSSFLKEKMGVWKYQTFRLWLCDWGYDWIQFDIWTSWVILTKFGNSIIWLVTEVWPSLRVFNDLWSLITTHQVHKLWGGKTPVPILYRGLSCITDQSTTAVVTLKAWATTTSCESSNSQVSSKKYSSDKSLKLCSVVDFGKCVYWFFIIQNIKQ